MMGSFASLGKGGMGINNRAIYGIDDRSIVP